MTKFKLNYKDKLKDEILGQLQLLKERVIPLLNDINSSIEMIERRFKTIKKIDVK